MIDYQVAGLPLHVLVVHAVVVGVPLLAATLVVLAAWPAARRVLWLPTLIGGLVLLGVTFLAVEAGKWLEERVPPAPLIEAHTAQGEDMIPWTIALVVVAALIAALAIVERRQRRAGTDPGPHVAATRSPATAERRRSPARVAIAVLLVVAAVGVGAGATWTVIRIGESGSRAVWEGSFSEEPLGR
ncbi:hypothetical protein [Agromyces sp. C10]|uniref:hypothetical protein n=1 Tax=Agromyces sp. C10 TaxID=2935077 RepID=UPI00200B5CF6|nr:hypothetical protein [Agromyces sp. C10]MCK8610295.1 hypothetical protein [Agromyces sp. C10]